MRIQPRDRYTPRCIDICAMINQDFDNLHISTCTGRMEGKNAIEDRVDGLAVVERVLDKADISSGCRRVETKIGNWVAVSAARVSREIKTYIQ